MLSLKCQNIVACRIVDDAGFVPRIDLAFAHASQTNGTGLHSQIFC